MSQSLPSTSHEEPTAPKRRRRHVEDLEEANKPLPLNLFHLGMKLNSDASVVQFAQSYGLLPLYGTCPTCYGRLDNVQTVQRAAQRPQYRFRCNKPRCRKEKSEVNLKKGTWFEGSHISMKKSLLLIHCFAVNLTNQQTIFQTSITDRTSSETVVDFYNYCREVCVEVLSGGSVANQIGGTNMTVEIDAVKFGKRKYKGKFAEGQWVLGGICRETKECFFVPIKDRTENNLISVIKEHVRLGSIIHTDHFPSYKLSTEGYQHVTVNQPENLVHPQTGACLNTIESTWWAIHHGLRSNSGPKKYFALHLAEYIWRKTHRNDEDIFISLMRDIGKVYPGVQH